MIEERDKQPQDQTHSDSSAGQQSLLLERQAAQKVLNLLETLSQIFPILKPNHICHPEQSKNCAKRSSYGNRRTLLLRMHFAGDNALYHTYDFSGVGVLRLRRTSRFANRFAPLRMTGSNMSNPHTQNCMLEIL